MRQLKRMWRSFHKNIIVKRKFKAYWTYFVDPEYKAQVDNIYKITAHCTGSKMMNIPTHMLVHGHKVIYLEYANSLVFNDCANLEPIKVVEHEGRYVVVDGNHRLPAIMSRYKRKKMQWTKCELIY
jgi:hypothetical protein